MNPIGSFRAPNLFPSTHSRHARRLLLSAWTLAASLLLAGCQSYEPQPLDPAGHRAAWSRRTLEDQTLHAFLDRQQIVAASDRFDASDGLALGEGRLVALAFHPDLRLARLRAGRAAATVELAGRWADPELSAQLLRIRESIPDRWVLSSALSLSIPLPGRLAAERQRARAEADVHAQGLFEAEWEVWRDVAAAWVQWSQARSRVEETERFLEAVQTFVESTAALAANGELPRTEAALFELERAQRANRLHHLRGAEAAAVARVRSLLGLAPEVSAQFLPTLELVGSKPIVSTDADLSSVRHPRLMRLQSEYELAEARLRLEVRKQYPNLKLGPAYESDEGQVRLGLVGGWPIPVWNSNRFAIEEARFGRELAREAFEVEQEAMVGRWAATQAIVAARTAQRDELEATLMPLIDRQLGDALELLRLGEGQSLVLLASLQRAHDAKLEWIDVRAALAQAQIEMEHLLGPTGDLEPGERQ